MTDDAERERAKAPTRNPGSPGARRTREWRAREDAGLRLLTMLVDPKPLADFLERLRLLPKLPYAGAEHEWSEVEEAFVAFVSRVIVAKRR